MSNKFDLKFSYCRYANPIFGDGDYPQVLRDQLQKKAAELNLPECPLPTFTEEEKALNKGVKQNYLS